MWETSFLLGRKQLPGCIKVKATEARADLVVDPQILAYSGNYSGQEVAVTTIRLRRKKVVSHLSFHTAELGLRGTEAYPF